MKNKRYDEVDHRDVNTMDDIDKIVKNEVRLDKQRSSDLKSGMAHATVMSIFIRIIITIVLVVVAAAIIFVSVMLLSYWSNVYVSNEQKIKEMKEQSSNNE